MHRVAFFYAFGVRVAGGEDVAREGPEGGLRGGGQEVRRARHDAPVEGAHGPLLRADRVQEEPVRRARQASPVRPSLPSLPSLPTGCTALQNHVQFNSPVSLAMNTVLFSSLFLLCVARSRQEAGDPRRGSDGRGHRAGVAQQGHADSRQGHEQRGDRARPAPDPEELLGPPEEAQDDPVRATRPLTISTLAFHCSSWTCRQGPCAYM